MANKEVKTTFPEAKLEALEYFLKEQGTTMEDAVREQLNKMYDRNVPKEVRKFLESRMPEEDMTPVQEEPASEQTPQRPSRRTPRANTRRTEAAPQDIIETPNTEEAANQEETPETGMIMEM